MVAQPVRKSSSDSSCPAAAACASSSSASPSPSAAFVGSTNRCCCALKGDVGSGRQQRKNPRREQRKCIQQEASHLCLSGEDPVPPRPLGLGARPDPGRRRHSRRRPGAQVLLPTLQGRRRVPQQLPRERREIFANDFALEVPLQGLEAAVPNPSDSQTVKINASSKQSRSMRTAGAHHHPLPSCTLCACVCVIVPLLCILDAPQEAEGEPGR